MRIGLITIAIIAFGAAGAAVETPPDQANWPACKMRHRVTVIRRLEDFPQAIQADFRRRVRDIAGPGEPFNSSDVIVNGDRRPSRRFLRGVQSGDIWFIWYEHGGFGLHRHILVYAIRVNGSSVLSGKPTQPKPSDRVEAALEENLAGDPCVATDAYLDGVRTTEDF